MSPSQLEASPVLDQEVDQEELDASCALLGVFPLPVGLLTLPPAAGAEETLARLTAGDTTVDVPESWSFLKAALEGDGATALELAAELPEPFSSYNRLVIGAAAGLAQKLTVSGALPSPLAELAIAAAYIHGLADRSPVVPEAGPPEARAAVRMVRAASALESGAENDALAELERAVQDVRSRSPVFAAQLLAQRAELLRSEPAKAMLELKQALDLSKKSQLPGQRSSLFVQYGLLMHEMSEGRRGPLLEAVKAYQNALQEGLADHPQSETYALVQSHLGLAYLAMPMEDQASRLRLGIAVQAFRKALEVYRPESHPELWASTQLNLANALQYLPSSHPQENLIQAVELYEQLLEVRNAATDPVGYARLLANQANALAHLGMFSPALVKLEEAHKLFHWHAEPELAASVLEQAASIHRRRDEKNEAIEGGAAEVESAVGSAAVDKAQAAETESTR